MANANQPATSGTSVKLLWRRSKTEPGFPQGEPRSQPQSQPQVQRNRRPSYLRQNYERFSEIHNRTDPSPTAWLGRDLDPDIIEGGGTGSGPEKSDFRARSSRLAAEKRADERSLSPPGGGKTPHATPTDSRSLNETPQNDNDHDHDCSQPQGERIDENGVESRSGSDSIGGGDGSDSSERTRTMNVVEDGDVRGLEIEMVQDIADVEAVVGDEEAVKYVEKKLEELLSGKTRGWRMRIMRFTASWFSVTMGTGIINTILFDLPWASTHVTFRYIGLVFLIFDAMLFLSFAALTIARYSLYPEIFPVMLKHEVHSLFLGTIPMGFVTIVNGIAIQAVDFGVKGPVVEVCTGLWWLALVMSLLTAFAVPYYMFTKHNHSTEALTAAWLLPVVPPTSVASAGSILAQLLLSHSNNPSYSLTILVTSYVLNGIGLLLSLLFMSIYFMRLAIHHLPARDVIVSSFLPLGPCGQAGYALINLGRVALELFPVLAERNPGNQAFQVLAMSAGAFYATGIVWGLLLWGLGIWWLFLAVASVSTNYVGKVVAFNMGWWSFTFPLGSMTLLTYGLGQVFDSMFFKVLGTVMTTVVVSLWVFVFLPTVQGWLRGTLFSSPCLASLPPQAVLRGTKAEKHFSKQASLEKKPPV